MGENARVATEAANGSSRPCAADGMNTMWSHLSDASRRRGRQRGEALMERRPQRGTNRGRSGMVARSTDGHKTNASLGAELLDGVRDGDASLSMVYGR